MVVFKKHIVILYLRMWSIHIIQKIFINIPTVRVVYEMKYRKIWKTFTLVGEERTN